MIRTTARAFTLIELLVVVAIIGLLSSVVMAGLNDARVRARDTQRLQELKQMQNALEAYHTANGQFPTACGGVTGAWKGTAAAFGDCDTDFIEGLSNELSRLPSDPLGDDATYGYMYRVSANRQGYKIMSYRRVEGGNILPGTPYSRCDINCGNSYCSQNTYAIYTPDMSCI